MPSNARTMGRLAPAARVPYLVATLVVSLLALAGHAFWRERAERQAAYRAAEDLQACQQSAVQIERSTKQSIAIDGAAPTEAEIAQGIEQAGLPAENVLRIEPGVAIPNSKSAFQHHTTRVVLRNVELIDLSEAMIVLLQAHPALKVTAIHLSYVSNSTDDLLPSPGDETEATVDPELWNAELTLSSLVRDSGVSNDRPE